MWERGGEGEGEGGMKSGTRGGCWLGTDNPRSPFLTDNLGAMLNVSYLAPIQV